MSLRTRMVDAWNAFQTEDKRRNSMEDDRASYQHIETPTYFRQDRYRMRYGNDRSILSAIYTRIANDIAAIQIQHIRVDENGRYLETIKSGLNECMTLSANIDQTSRDFWVDLVLSMLDEGVVAGVPVDTDIDIVSNNRYDILSLRTGKIIDWFPSTVRVEVYNERTGQKETLTLPKDKIAIIENPFYAVMNEPNSTLKRLIYKMNLLDQIDGDKASSKLNMLIQLPYSLKSPTRIAQAEERKAALEDQLSKSKYGVAYIDSTEHVTQLNRALENDLPAQIQTLTEQLYNQIGISADVFRGTANQEMMMLYSKKVLKPILDTIELEFTRKFLTPTARTQGQRIGYFIDAFDMVTPTEVGDMANSLSRNEIVSANELRAVLGLKPNDSPRSDQLINKNMPIDQVDPEAGLQNQNESDYDSDQEDMSRQLDELESMLDGMDSEDESGELSQSEIILEQLKNELESDSGQW